MSGLRRIGFAFNPYNAEARAVLARAHAWCDASTRVADLGTTSSEEHVTMTTDTHTMAGLLASAGAARLGAVTLAECAGRTPALAPYGVAAVHQGSGSHLSSTWTQGAIAKPATFMVLDRKNRPTRPLSELSP